MIIPRSFLTLRPQQRLYRAAFVHCAVALGHLIESQGQVEDLAGVDNPLPHEVDQVRQEAAYGRRATVEVDVGEEHS